MSIFNSSNETKKFAKEILKLAKKENINLLLLQGDLGSGKTTFVQGLGKALGIKNNIPSPTFVLMRQYQNLVHIDLYRVDKDFNLEGLGFSELLDSDNLVVVEWPERVDFEWPKPHLLIRFGYVNETRRRIESEVMS